MFHGLDLQLSEVGGTLSTDCHGPGSVGVKGNATLLSSGSGTLIVATVW